MKWSRFSVGDLWNSSKVSNQELFNYQFGPGQLIMQVATQNIHLILILSNKNDKDQTFRLKKGLYSVSFWESELDGQQKDGQSNVLTGLIPG